MTDQPSSNLAATTARFLAGAADGDALISTFLESTVYAVRLGSRPALAAYDDGPGVTIPVFTSLEQLALWFVRASDPVAQAAGVEWLSATGADLLAEWPAGCDLLLDAASAHPVRYPAAAFRALA